MSRTRICFLEGLPTITSIVEGFGGVPSSSETRHAVWYHHCMFEATPDGTEQLYIPKGHNSEWILSRKVLFQRVKVRSYYTALNCVAVPICLLLSAANHRSINAFQVKMSLTFMRHRNAVTSQYLCKTLRCGNATQRNNCVVWRDLYYSDFFFSKGHYSEDFHPEVSVFWKDFLFRRVIIPNLGIMTLSYKTFWNNDTLE